MSRSTVAKLTFRIIGAEEGKVPLIARFRIVGNSETSAILKNC